MSKSYSQWYPKYVGDYSRKTRHLSMMEHGAFNLLLDHYYSTGAPLPANADVLHRICMAFADEEKQAMQNVLAEFFVLQDGFYHNKNADEKIGDIEKRADISQKRRDAAKVRWQKQANANASDEANPDANGNAKAMQMHDTTTTTVIGKKEEDKSSSKEKRATRIPDGAILSDDFLEIARQVSEEVGTYLDDRAIRIEWEKIKDWSRSAPGGAKKCWKSAWRNWIRNAKPDANRPGPRAADRVRFEQAQAAFSAACQGGSTQ